MRNSFLVCFRVLVVIAALLGCTPSSKKNNRIFIAQDIAPITSLDPGSAYEVSTVALLLNIYRRLFYVSNEKIANDLVESYRVLNKGKTLRVQIKRNQFFASGNPVTAQDVVYSVRRTIMLQRTPSLMLAPLGYLPENVSQSVRYVDRYTVDFVLSKTVSEDILLSCLASSAACILDSELIKKHTVDEDYGAAWLEKAYAGGGPLMLGVWHPREVITLKKNQWYSGPFRVSFNLLMIRHVSNPSARLSMLESGEVDVACGLRQEQIDLAESKYQIFKHQSGTIWYLNLNQRNAYLRNPFVQKAIRLLINYEKVRVAFGSGIADTLHTLVPSNFEGYVNDLPCEKFDPESAKQIIHENYGHDIELDLAVYDLAVGQVLQQDFAKGGIRLRLNYCEKKDTTDQVDNRKHTLVLKHFSPDFPHTYSFLSIFVSNPGLMAYRNSLNMEELQSKMIAMTTADKPKRKLLYREIQEAFLKKPLIILAETKQAFAISHKIKNFGSSVEVATIHYFVLEKLS